MIEAMEESQGAPPGNGASLFSEDELLQQLRGMLHHDGPRVLLGVGDDAALVELGRTTAVVTTDMMVEGVHFDRRFTSATDLGYKAIVVNVSDVAAMAAVPCFAVVCVGLPRGTATAWVLELYRGMIEAAQRYGVALVGGDLSRSDLVVIAPTLIGDLDGGTAVRRAGARPGDRVVVTGALGGSAGGLQVAARVPATAPARATPWARDLLARHFRPEARVREAAILARAGATAMMDLSDGLTKDLGRLCRESGVGAEVRLPDIPFDPRLLELRAVLPVDPLALALEGGEDMELLATLPPQAVEEARRALREGTGTSLVEIGRIRQGGGLVARDGRGATRPLEEGGWDHFAV